MSILAPSSPNRTNTPTLAIDRGTHPFGISETPSPRHGTALAASTEAQFNSLNKSENPKIQAILERYNIDGKLNTAALSKDGANLVLAISGKTAAAKLFSNSWFSGANSLGLKWYKQLYDPAANPSLEFKSDSPDDLIKSLKSDHYHAQVLFKRNADGSFSIDEPSFISISDSYWFAAEHAKLGNEVQQRYRHYYTIDKTVANPSEKDLLACTKTIAEAFFTLLPKSNGLIVPFALGNNLNGVYARNLSWRFPLFTKDNKWQEQQGEVSFLRPAQRAAQDIDPVIARLDMQTRISSGTKMLAGYEENKAMVEKCIAANEQQLQQLGEAESKQN